MSQQTPPQGGPFVTVDGIRVELVRHERRDGPRQGLVTFWDAYLEHRPEEPLTMGDAQPTRAQLVRWLNSPRGRRIIRAHSEPFEPYEVGGPRPYSAE